MTISSHFFEEGSESTGNANHPDIHFKNLKEYMDIIMNKNRTER